MKSVGEKLVLGPLESQLQERKTRQEIFLTLLLIDGHENFHKGINIMFEMPSQQIRCFLILRGEIFTDP
jgi:hypothetical protein